MNIIEFDKRVSAHAHVADKNEPERVVIQLEEPGVGSTPCVNIETMYAGFDWDHGKIIIVPAEPLVRKKEYSTAERDFVARAIERGYKYICRCANGDIIISQNIPIRTTRSWKYDKKVSERTSLYKNDFKKLTFENGGVIALSCLIYDYR